MARTKFSDLRDAVVAKPGATERLAASRVETVEEIRLYELGHGEAISQVELAGRLDVVSSTGDEETCREPPDVASTVPGSSESADHPLVSRERSDRVMLWGPGKKTVLFFHL